MVEWKQKHPNIVYDDGTYQVDFQPRNNPVKGEPAYKVWIYREYNEIAKLDDNFRGYGRYAGNANAIPECVMAKAQKTWKRIKSGYYTDEVMKKLQSDNLKKATKIIISEEKTGIARKAGVAM